MSALSINQWYNWLIRPHESVVPHTPRSRCSVENLLLKFLGIAAVTLSLSVPLAVLGAGPAVPLIEQVMVDQDAGEARSLTASDQAVERGRALMLQGRLDLARETLEDVLRLHPDHAEAWRWLGHIALRERRHDEAIRAFSHAVERAPQDHHLRLELGAALEEAGRPEQAREVYRDLLGMDQSLAEAWFRLGAVTAGLGHEDEAIDAYERLAALPDAPPARARVAGEELDRLYARQVDAWLARLERGEVDVRQSVEYGRALGNRRRFAEARRVFAAAAAEAPDNPEVHYWYGRSLMTLREFDDGLAILERSVELAPGNHRLKLELGGFYETAGRFDDAHRVYTELLDETTDPSIVGNASRQKAFIDAARLIAARDLEGALALYRELLAQSPGDTRLLELMAPLLEELRRYDESDRIFEELMARQPDDLALHIRIAATYEARGDEARARELYTEVLRMEPPGDIAARALEGLGLGRAGEYIHEDRADDALAIFDEVLAILPRQRVALLGRAMALHRLQRFDEAEAAYLDMLAESPDNELALLELGELYRETGRVEDAIETFERVQARAVTQQQFQLVAERLTPLYGQRLARIEDALQRGVADIDEVVAFGETLVSRGFNQEAVDILRRALELAPQDARVHVWLGRAELGLGETARGLALIERGTELAPTDMATLAELAQVYEQLERFDDARRMWREIQRRSPDASQRAVAERSLGLLEARRLREAGDFAGALSVFEQLALQFPGDRQFQLGQATLLIELGREDEAEEVFAEALAQAPDDIGLYLQLARLYQAAELPERAEGMYREAIALDPDNVGARLAFGTFHQSRGEFERAFDEFERAMALAEGTAQQPQVGQALNALSRGVIDNARRLLSLRQYGEAEDVMRGLVERLPDNAEVRFWMSEIYREQGDYAQQAEQLAAVAETGGIAMQRRLGLAYVNAEMPDEAEQALTAVIEAFPFDSEIRARLADLHQQRGDEAAARAEYIELLALNPTAEWRELALDWLGLAEARRLRETGQPQSIQRALALVEPLLDEVPGQPLVLLELARIHGAAGRPSAAEAAFREMLALEPAHAEGRLGLARVLAAEDREDEAVAIYHPLAVERPPTVHTDAARSELDALLLARIRERIEQVEEADPEEAIATLLPLGAEAHRLGAHTAARLAFERVIRLDTEHAEAHYRLGLVYAADDDHADSLVMMRRATEIEPDNARYHHGHGVAYRELQLDRSAEQAFQQAIRLQPDNPAPRFELADLYQRRGEGDAARLQYLRAFERSSNRPEVARALAGLGLAEDPDQLDQLALEQALRLFRDSLSIAPRAPQVRLYIGIVYQRTQNFAEAETIYRQILNEEPGQILTAMRMAGLFADTNRLDESIALFGRIAESAPDPGLAARARQDQTVVYVRKVELALQEFRSDTGDVDAALELGRTLFERNVFEPIAPLLEEATRAAPDNPQTWYWYGRTMASLGRFDIALPALERSVEMTPGNLLLEFQLAQAYQRGGAIDEAETLFDSLSRQQQNPAIQRQARLNLGRIRAAQREQAGDPAGALREYEAMLTLAPEDVSLLGERGRLLVAVGREDEADATFERVLQLAPDNLGVRLTLAELYRQRDESARYLEQLRFIIESAPRSQEARQARAMLGFEEAMALLGQDAVNDAREILERLLAVVPGDALTRHRLGEIYARQRMFAEAERELTEAVRLMPDYQDAQLALGRLYETLERPDSAIRAYERTIELGRDTQAGRDAQPLLAGLYGAQVRELIEQGRDDEAIIGLVRLLQSAPTNIPARTTLANMYSQTGRYDDAIQLIEVAIRIQPDNPRLHRQLAAIYTQNGDDLRAAGAYAWAISLETDEQLLDALVRELIMSVARHFTAEDQPFASIRHLRSLNEAGLGNERTYFMLAAIYRQQGRYDEATRAFRDAVRFAPDNVAMRFNLAELYERNNDLDLAQIQYRHIVRVGEPGDRIVEEARRRASALRDRLALFTSQLSYNMTLGDSNIEEQDLGGTGAINTSFNSQLFYNLATNFRPRPSTQLRLDTGVIYVSNHSTERDTLVPRIGGSANLNFPSHFYGLSAHATQISEMVSDTEQGRSYNASLSAGLRFTDIRDLFSTWRRARLAGHGEAELERSPASRAVDAELENPRLRRALEEHWRRELLAPPSPPTLPPPVAVPFALDAPADDAFGIPAETAVVGPDALDPEARLERLTRIRARVEDGMSQYRRAVLSLRAGRLDDARQRFISVLDLAPNDPRTLTLLGRVFERQGRDEAAGQAWQAALAADPAAVVAGTGLAELLLEHDNPHAAAAVLAGVVREAGPEAAPVASPETAAVARRIGDALLDRPTLSPRDLEVLMPLADSLLALGEADAARTLVAAVLDADPQHALANDRMAGLLLDDDSAVEAITHARRSVAAEPDHAGWRLRLARALAAAGEYAEAEEVYERVLDIADDDAMSRTARLEQLEARAARAEADGNPGRAIDLVGDALGQAPAQGPQRFDLQLRLGDLYAAAGNDELAEDGWLAALALAVDDRQRRTALDRLGFAEGLDLLERGRWRRALRVMDGINEIAPDQPLVLVNLGVINQQLRRYVEAEAAYQQVLDADPRNLTARMRLGLLYSETDRIDRALTLLEQVASEGPGTRAAGEAAEALEGLEQRRMRRLVGEEIERETPTMKTLQARAFYSDTQLPVEALTESFSYGVTLSFFYRSLATGDWTFQYTFGTRENEHPLGTDYAYNWNDLGVTWRRSVPNFRGWFGPSENIPGLTGSIAYNREMRLYNFADTNALNALGIAQQRKHDTDQLTLGLTYSPPGADRLNYFFNYTYGRSRANLPVGIIFSPDGIPVALQSRGLGDFDPNFFTLGLSFQF